MIHAKGMLPVNWDAFTDLVLYLANTALFPGFIGALDASGQCSAQLNAPTLPSAAVGLVMSYAYCCNNPFDFVSNPVDIEIVN